MSADCFENGGAAVSGSPLFTQEQTPGHYVISRRMFLVQTVHWAILAAAVPVFVFVRNGTAFSLYWSLGFFSFLLLTFTDPTRYLIDSRNTRGKKVCLDLKLFSIVLRVSMILFGLLAGFCFIVLLRQGGGPHLDNGVPCIWNHGFIREITQEEFIRLGRIERSLFTAGLAWFKSSTMLACCHVDRIV